jgi:mono/diheme cytochrome c family protein
VPHVIGTVVFVVVFLVLGLSVVLVAMRSGRKPSGTRKTSRAGRRAWGVGVGLLIVLTGIAVPALVLANNGENHAKHGPGGVDLSASATHGRELFARNCATCHTLAGSNAVGRVGPNLDDLIVGVQNKDAFVLDAITRGRSKGNGQMPANLLVGQDAKDVAAYVGAVAGR